MSFAALAAKVAEWSGHPAVFLGHLVLFIAWGAWGPSRQYDDQWHLILGTVTSVTSTFMVLLIQNTQGRDSKAIQLKLDELIHTTAEARNDLIGAERNHTLDLDAMRPGKD